MSSAFLRDASRYSSSRKSKQIPGLDQTLVRLWRFGLAFLVLETLVLLLWSHFLWSHFDESLDFAVFFKAFQNISTGHFTSFVDAYNNLPYFGPTSHYRPMGFQFIDNNFELWMYPLALVGFLWHSSFVLLVFQLLLTQAAVAMAFRFGLELIAEAKRVIRQKAIVATVFFLLLVLSPWTLWAISFDFHFEPAVVVFLVLAVRDLYFKSWRFVFWCVLVLMGGDVSTTWLIGVGLGMLAFGDGKRQRLMAFSMTMIGIVWLIIIFALHGAQAASVQANYGYLLGKTTSQGGMGVLLALLIGIPTHLGQIASVVLPRKIMIYRWIASGGIIGVLSPIGIGITSVVLGINSINAASVFIDFYSGFQNFVVVVLVSIGSIYAYLKLALRFRYRNHKMRILQTIAIVIIVQSLVLSVVWLPRAENWFSLVSSNDAAVLAEVLARTPANAEVVATMSIEGRFAGRSSVFPFTATFAGGQTVPLIGSSIVFVFYFKNNQSSMSAEMNRQAAKVVEAQLHPSVILAKENVLALLVHQDPRVVRSIILP